MQQVLVAIPLVYPILVMVHLKSSCLVFNDYGNHKVLFYLPIQSLPIYYYYRMTGINIKTDL